MASGLHKLVLECRFKQLKYRFDSGCNIDFRSQKGNGVLVTSLHIQDPKKRKKMFNWLLRRGANIQDVDPSTGRDVMSWACALGREEEIRKLLEVSAGGFDFQRRDSNGHSPLHCAVRSQNVDIVRAIVGEMKKYNIPIDVPDQDGMTPYLLAHRMGLCQIAQVLAEEGEANPKQFDMRTFRSKTQWLLLGKKERKHAVGKGLEEVWKINGKTSLPKLGNSRCPRVYGQDTIRTQLGESKSLKKKYKTRLPSLSSDDGATSPESPEQGDSSVSEICGGSGSTPDDKEDGEGSEQMLDLYGQLSLQLCDAYRPSYIPKFPKPSGRKGRPGAFRKLSTLAVLLSSVKSKDKKQGKKPLMGNFIEESIPEESSPRLGRRGTDGSLHVVGRSGSKLSGTDSCKTLRKRSTVLSLSPAQDTSISNYL